jgi:hypothetical protein
MVGKTAEPGTPFGEHEAPVEEFGYSEILRKW